MKNSIFFLLITACIAIGGCRAPTADNPKNINQTNLSLPLDYGNGVYYFTTVGAELGNSLSSFLKSHPELELLSIAPDDNGRSDGSYQDVTSGYFVIFKNKRQADDFMP